MDIRIIHELYWNQTAKFKLNHTSQISNIRIAKRICQECIFPPFLFNIYVEKIFQLAFKGRTTGIKINGIPINNLQYADDMAIVGNIEEL